MATKKDNREVVFVQLEEVVYGEPKMPTRAHEDDAGYDIYVSETTTIDPHSFADVPSGVRMELPDGHWGLLTGRSSTVRNRGLLVIQGVIDQGYRGELFSAAWNLTDHPVVLKQGDRVAQLIIVPNATAATRLVQADTLSVHVRGTKGFGSSGL